MELIHLDEGSFWHCWVRQGLMESRLWTQMSCLEMKRFSGFPWVVVVPYVYQAGKMISLMDCNLDL